MDTGIIAVVKKEKEEDTELADLAKLQALPKFEPFLKTQNESTFNWSFFSSTPSKKKTPLYDLNPEPLEKMLDHMREHAQTCAQEIATDQRILTERVSSMDEYCAKLTNTVSSRIHQAKTFSDALTKVGNIKRHAETTRVLVSDILVALDNLEDLLEPGERLDHPDNMKR
ncbi:hypothetical protein HDU76_006219 [Blyttiomyces sp. JEL0837]|nr:hypothetical protein HDU76_006219 [Blyttiomyces sp. JEL0837]